MNNIQVLSSKGGQIFEGEPTHGLPGWIWRDGDYVEMRYFTGDNDGWITLEEYDKRIDSQKQSRCGGNFDHIFSVQ